MVAACALALGACKVDVAVDVEAQADGRGEVRVTAVLDEEAAEEAGDLAVRVRTEDLTDAGWIVEPPRSLPGGGATLTVRREFSSPDAGRRVLAQLAEPFDAFTIEQRRSFFRTTTRFAGTVDLTDGIAAFSDERLTSALGGEPLGVPAEVLEQRAGVRFSEAFALALDVDLPGTERTWQLPLDRRTDLDATATQWNVANIAALALAVASTVALAAVTYARRRGRPRDDAPAADES